MSTSGRTMFRELVSEGLSRRKALGFAGVLAAAALFPRWLWAQAGNARAILKDYYSAKVKGGRPTIDALASGLRRSSKLAVRRTVVESEGGEKMGAIVFPDGTIFADGAGDGADGMSDYDFKGAADSIVDKLSKTATANDGQVQSYVNLFENNMPSLTQQTSYPLDTTAQLFARAQTVAKKRGAGAQRQLKSYVDRYVSYLRQEKKLREQLLGLNFVSKSRSEIEQAAAEQKRLLTLIRELRERRILPLFRQVAGFVGNDG